MHGDDGGGLKTQVQRRRLPFARMPKLDKLKLRRLVERDADSRQYGRVIDSGGPSGGDDFELRPLPRQQQSSAAVVAGNKPFADEAHK